MGRISVANRTTLAWLQFMHINTGPLETISEAGAGCRWSLEQRLGQTFENASCGAGAHRAHDDGL